MGSIWGYRRELRDAEPRFRVLIVPSLIGGMAGAAGKPGDKAWLYRDPDLHGRESVQLVRDRLADAARCAGDEDERRRFAHLGAAARGVTKVALVGPFKSTMRARLGESSTRLSPESVVNVPITNRAWKKGQRGLSESKRSAWTRQRRSPPCNLSLQLRAWASSACSSGCSASCGR
jgi:hypothetical protein